MQNDFDISTFLNNFSTCCSKVTKRSFVKGEQITTYIEKRNQMCILLERNSKFS